MVVGSPDGDPAHGKHALTGAPDAPKQTAGHRRLRVAVWSLVAVLLVLCLGTAGYLWINADSSDPAGTAADVCGGNRVTTNIAASPDQFSVMSNLAKSWNSQRQQAAGHCVRVNVFSAEPSKIAAGLGPTWDVSREGPRPDVWAADSTAWRLVASARPEAARLLPSEAPSVATSAIVLALPKPMAQAMGWPTKPVRMPKLLGALATGRTWANFGHPEWGRMRFGMADPTRSAAALSVLLAVIDQNGDHTISNDEITASVGFTSAVSAFAPNTAVLFNQLKQAGPPAKALPASVIFPTDEQELAAYRASKPAVDLVPIYPGAEGSFADHPFAILEAPWVDATRFETATKFRDYLLSAPSQRAYGAAGFRDVTASNRYAPMLSTAQGFDPSVRPSMRVPDATAVNQAMTQWTLLQRPTNILIVLDTSGSMNDRVPGTDSTRLQLMQSAAVKGTGLLNNFGSMGLWQFSSRLTPTSDHRELVPLGPASGKVGDLPRREALIAAIKTLRAKGGTGLYDTTYAAYLTMQKAWQPQASNVIVMITDGKNEDDVGLNRAQLIAKLRTTARPDRPVAILAIAVGPAADANALQQITGLTEGRTIIAKNDADALKEVILAFAGRLR